MSGETVAASASADAIASATASASAGAPAGTAGLPTVVIGGYLGAGKTTLVNRLLRAEATAPAGTGRRIAVLVNDFGEVSIDADLIEGAAGDVLSLAGGCVCCSFGADLVGTLARVAARRPQPEAVLIEASGVGLPAAVASTARLVPEVRVDGIVVVADATALRRQAAERYVGSTVRRQLHEADLLFVAKADLAGAGELADLEAWLGEAEVTAPRVLGTRLAPGCAPQRAFVAAADLSNLVFGPRLAASPMTTRTFPRREMAADPTRADRLYVSATHRFASPVDAAALAQAQRDAGVLRAKGLVLDVSGRWLEVQVAGRRIELRPRAGPEGAGPSRGIGGDTQAPAGRLVTISLRAAGGTDPACSSTCQGRRPPARRPRRPYAAPGMKPQPLTRRGRG